MAGVPYKYRSRVQLLRRYTQHLEQLMESGEFFRLSYAERRKLTRRVKRLYSRLAGPVPAVRLHHILAGSVAALSLAGCPLPGVGGTDTDAPVEEDDPAENDDPAQEQTNTPPTVTISGGGVTVTAGESVSLTANASDDDGDTLSFQWFVDGQPEQGATGDTFTTTFTPQTDTQYTVSVEVSDGTDSATDETSVTVHVEPVDTNGAPEVVLSATSQTIDNAGEATLTANATDPDGDTLTYAWFVDGTLQSGEAGETFTFSAAPVLETDYLIAVEVSDGSATAQASLTVTVSAQQPLNPSFGAYQVNPFGLDEIAVYSNGNLNGAPTFADLDGDGDYDMHFVFQGLGTNSYIAENLAADTGTPGFADGFTTLAELEVQVYDFSSYDDPYSYITYESSTTTTLIAHAFADLDSDGDFDVVAGYQYMYDGAFSFSEYFGLTSVENTTDGGTVSFAEPAYTGFTGSILTGADNLGGGSPSLVDIDADGDLDVFHADSFITGVSFLRNADASGDGSAPGFEAPVNVVGGPPYYINLGGATPHDVSLADFDKDGDYDMFVAAVESGTREIHSFENTGSPSAAEFTAHPDNPNPFGINLDGSGTVTRFDPFFVEVADVDLDGDLDLVTFARPSTFTDANGDTQSGLEFHFLENTDF